MICKGMVRQLKALENKTTGLIVSADYKKTRFKLLYIAMIIILAVLAVICLFPPVWLALSCFKDVRELLSVPPKILPERFDFGKILDVWKSMNFVKYYMNTITMTVGEIAVCVCSTGLAGYVLSRLKPKGTKLISAVIMWTMMMPNTVSMVPLFMTFINFSPLHINLTDTYIPMWIMAGANTFYILVFKSFFDSIPISLIEAARVDGCSDFSIFFRIIAPLSKAVVMVVAIFSFNAAWGNFLWPYLILKSEETYTVMVQIFIMKGTSWAIDDYICALFFAILPPVILFIIFQKQIMTGFSLGGGVKG